jgi:signal transduction histidine kinase
MINPSITKMDLSVRNIRTFIFGFEKFYGKNALIKFLESMGLPLSYFEDENNWVSFDYYCHFLDRLVEYSGSIDIPYKFGLNASMDKSWGILKIIIKSFLTCAFNYKALIALSPRWVKSGMYRIIKLKKNRAVIEYKLRQDLKQTKNNCLIGIQSQLSSIPIYYNSPPAKIRELQCAAEGADSCIYEITWRNPPYKKTGFYFLLIWIIISVGLSQLTQFNIISILFIHFLFILIIPVACYSLWKIIISKITLKEHYNKTEEQNELLGKNLLEIEKANEILQRKIEERTEKLTASNKEIEKSIAELKNNEDELIRSGKSALIGALTEEIANTLKKPINTIQGKLNEILQNTSASYDDDKINNILTNAQIAAERCEKIINELLSFSHNGNHSNYLEININMLIEECVTKANEEISNPDIEIETQLSDNLPKIFANYNQIKQVIMIFLTNANDAISELHKNNNSIKGKISISTSLKNKDILVEIKDTGCGIPKDAISKIFDPFFSTKTTSKRKGMGLTLSYNIIKKLDGRIEVESIPGKGTAFNIFIPAE